VIRAIDQCNLEIRHREASQRTTFSSFKDTLLDRRNIFLRNRPTANLVLKDNSGAILEGFEVDYHVTELTVTTCLLAVAIAEVADGLGDCFTISDAGLADVRLHLKFAQETGDQYIQMKLAHTGDNGLTGSFVLADLEGRIFFCQLDQRVRHFFLVGFGLGFDRNRNHRIGEADGFQQHRIGGVTQRVASEAEFQTQNRANITRTQFFYILTAVGVHAQQTPNAFFLILRGIVDATVLFDFARINPDVCQPPHVGIGYDLKDQR